MTEVYKPPVPYYGFDQKDSFAYETIVSRWPSILANISTTVSKEIESAVQLQNGKSGEDKALTYKVQEGKTILEAINLLKLEIDRDSEILPIQDDGGANVELYNGEIERLRAEGIKTWYQTSWIFAECYLYRRLRTIFALNSAWNQFDPFFSAKEETFRSSSKAIYQLAHTLEDLEHTPSLLSPEAPKDGKGGQSPLEIVFLEMLQMSLWGNATDLSLLVNTSYEDMQKLQSVGKAAQEESAKFILRNDLGKVWEWCSSQKGVGKKRLDIVLDNAGFELYTDLVFADFMITYTPFFDEVVFHPKTIPWFVSDVMPIDFSWTISTLLSSSTSVFFPLGATQEDKKAVKAVAERWDGYVKSGKFRLSVPLETKIGARDVKDFWTTSLEFQRMPQELVDELAEKSGLVVFKGDLNYRKLAADAQWPPTASWDEVLGPIARKFPILSLRTNKADVIVGLEKGVAEKTEKVDKRWKWSGKYAVVSFCPQE